MVAIFHFDWNLICVRIHRHSWDLMSVLCFGFKFDFVINMFRCKVCFRFKAMTEKGFVLFGLLADVDSS